MTLWIQIALVAAATSAVVFAAGPLLARGLRLNAIQAQFAAMAARLATALLLATALAASGAEHRIALVFTVGAAYFAAALVDGLKKFRNRETNGCLTR